MKAVVIRSILIYLLIAPNLHARTITGPEKRAARPVRKNTLQESEQSLLRIRQLKKVVNNSHSTIAQSAKEDLTHPFIKELDRNLSWIKKHHGQAPLFTTGRMTLVD